MSTDPVVAAAEQAKFDIVGSAIANQVFGGEFLGLNAGSPVIAERRQLDIGAPLRKGKGAVGKVGQVGTRVGDVGFGAPGLAFQLPCPGTLIASFQEGIEILFRVLVGVSFEGGGQIKIRRLVMLVGFLVHARCPTGFGLPSSVFPKNIERIVVLGRGCGQAQCGQECQYPGEQETHGPGRPALAPHACRLVSAQRPSAGGAVSSSKGMCSAMPASTNAWILNSICE